MRVSPSAYLHFTRHEWEQYRHDTPLRLTVDDLTRLQGVNEIVSLDEIRDVFLPLSRLINMYVTETQSLHRVTSAFLSSAGKKVPYIIGVSGSVAVGKSTTSRVLQALLSRWENHPKVALVTTDGFLYSTAELESRGIMNRKGFPESYRVDALLSFLEQLKSGATSVTVPVYSHQHYDIIPDEVLTITEPDIVIIEGLNILQTSVSSSNYQPNLFVSDFLDFSIFVDADIEAIRDWYVERVLYFANTLFKDPDNYFYFLSQMTHDAQTEFAKRIWRDINEVNLLENILPFRERASLILHKGKDHAVDRVMLRRL